MKSSEVAHSISDAESVDEEVEVEEEVDVEDEEGTSRGADTPMHSARPCAPSSPTKATRHVGSLLFMLPLLLLVLVLVLLLALLLV